MTELDTVVALSRGLILKESSSVGGSVDSTPQRQVQGDHTALYRIGEAEYRSRTLKFRKGHTSEGRRFSEEEKAPEKCRENRPSNRSRR